MGGSVKTPMTDEEVGEAYPRLVEALAGVLTIVDAYGDDEGYWPTLRGEERPSLDEKLAEGYKCHAEVLDEAARALLAELGETK